MNGDLKTESRHPSLFPMPRRRPRAPPSSPISSRLAGRARDYVEASSSANTRRAYASDWAHFSPVPPSGARVSAALPSGGRAVHHRLRLRRRDSGGKANSVSDLIERRPPALGWKPPPTAAPRWIARTATSPPCSLASAIPMLPRPGRRRRCYPLILIAMLEVLERGTLRGLRDRADAAARLRRRITALGDRRARLRARPDAGRARLGGNPRQGEDRHSARQTAGARSRSARARRTPPARSSFSPPG